MSDVSEEKYAGVLAVANGWKARALSAEQREQALAAHVEAGKAVVANLLETEQGGDLSWAQQDRITEAAEWVADKPETSLARLIAEKQAEGAALVGALLVDEHESNFPGGEDEIARICDEALRRQAEE